jgi:hypothetical protein
MEREAALMSRSRAMMTETDRAQIAGDDGDHKRYQAVSRVRDRLDALEDDVTHLEEHHPQLLVELRAVVCADDDSSANDDGESSGRVFNL